MTKKKISRSDDKTNKILIYDDKNNKVRSRSTELKLVLKKKWIQLPIYLISDR